MLYINILSYDCLLDFILYSLGALVMHIKIIDTVSKYPDIPIWILLQQYWNIIPIFVTTTRSALWLIGVFWSQSHDSLPTNKLSEKNI